MKINYSVSWILQKIFAIIFLFLLIYTFFSLKNVSLSYYYDVLDWFSKKLNLIIFLILFSSIILHSNLGLNSIIDDYIHDENNKKKIILLKNTFLITIYLILLISLLTID